MTDLPLVPALPMQIDYDEWINRPRPNFRAGRGPSEAEDEAWGDGYIAAAKRGAVHTLALLESRDQRIQRLVAVVKGTLRASSLQPDDLDA